MAKTKNEGKQTQSAPKEKKGEPREEVEETTTDEAVAEPTRAEVKEIKVIERVIENHEIAPADAFGKLTRPQVNLMKRTIAKGASDDELKMFIQVCKGANLNPFLKQVFLVPRWDGKEGREVRAIQVSIDGFRSIAESSGAYAGNDDPIYAGEKEIEYGKDKKKLMVPDQATVTVRKLIGGQVCEFTATARWPEYYPGEKMGFQWHIRPYLMLGKCAEALALRKAFPKLLSGMYAQEEMDKTVDGDKEAGKIQNGFKTLMNLVDGATEEDLKEFQDKMEKSDKYTFAQKLQFKKSVEKRIAELKAPAKE